MYTGLSHLHHYLPYVLLSLMVLVTIKAFIGLAQGSDYSPGDKKLGLLSMIAAHLQFTLGIVLYFVSPMVVSIGDAMGNATSRLYALEHPLMMLIAVVLLTIARSKTKTINDSSAHKTIAIMYSIALVAILSRIPWEQWLA